MTTTGAPLRAGIYVRQSVDVAEGIERQRDRCRRLAELREWSVVTEYADNDVSASKPRGAGTAWARMLADIRAGHVDVVVAVDLDRILRTIQDLATLIGLGVRVTTVDGEIDTSSAWGEFQATLATALARFEVRRKSERQVRANEARAARGEWVGGRRPFGFDADGVTVREDEAEAIRTAYRDLLAGMSLAAIARLWNQSGFVTGQTRQARSGNAGAPSEWRADGVRVVLLNPRYAGQVRYKGHVQTKDGVPVSAEWPAIVDEATFAAAVALLMHPQRRTGGRAASMLLTGIARCGVDGCAATVHAGGNARRGVPAYRCSGSLGHVARMAKPVDEYVAGLIVERLSRKDAVRLIERDVPDREALWSEASGVRARLETLAVDFADGELTASQLKVATSRLRERLDAIDRLLIDASRADILGPLVRSDDVQETWDELLLEQRRTVISRLVEDLVVMPPGRGTRRFRPESVRVEWRQD